MDFLATLRHSHFAKLWFAQILSQIAQNLLNFALIIEVFSLAQHTHFANISVGLVVLAFGVPSILFAAAAGSYVDRWNRKTVLVVSNLLRTLLVLVYLGADKNLVAILSLTFIIASVNQFFVPAEAATIPNLVPAKLLINANSLFIFSLYTSFIVGFSLSGPVIAGFGNNGPFYTTSLMFALATLLVVWLPKGQSRPTNLGEVVQPKLHAILQDNLQIIRRDRWIGFAIIQLTITQTVVGVILALAPALSVAVLHEPLQKAAWYLIFPAGFGMVAGVASISTLAKKWSKVRILEVCLVVAATALTGLGLTGLLYRNYHGHSIVPYAEIGIIVAVLVFALGMLNAIISATAQTLLQEKSSDEVRGKIFGSLNMMINIASTVPIFVAGILADLLSVTEVITLIGAAVVVYALLQLRLLRHDDGTV